MPCPRCQGLMAKHWLCDNTEWELAWKCYNCGNVLDALILVNHHRVMQPVDMRRVGRRRLYATD